ncbi:expressed protein [Echinococcus multilocularis]|uniref:Expressed protein n=1 Tax=Echinococcus multilocularis TaxID=6211 RepID=A0A087VX40_ECHMU|nr:expressed protein [Echinococcus multilocularis]
MPSPTFHYRNIRLIHALWLSAHPTLTFTHCPHLLPTIPTRTHPIAPHSSHHPILLEQCSPHHLTTASLLHLIQHAHIQSNDLSANHQYCLGIAQPTTSPLPHSCLYSNTHTSNPTTRRKSSNTAWALLTTPPHHCLTPASIPTRTHPIAPHSSNHPLLLEQCSPHHLTTASLLPLFQHAHIQSNITPQITNTAWALLTTPPHHCLTPASLSTRTHPIAPHSSNHPILLQQCSPHHLTTASLLPLFKHAHIQSHLTHHIIQYCLSSAHHTTSPLPHSCLSSNTHTSNPTSLRKSSNTAWALLTTPPHHCLTAASLPTRTHPIQHHPANHPILLGHCSPHHLTTASLLPLFQHAHIQSHLTPQIIHYCFSSAHHTTSPLPHSCLSSNTHTSNLTSLITSSTTA